MRTLYKLALISALGWAAPIAPVHAANGSIWDHNGSKMTLEEDGEKRKLVYTEPREGLDKAGIKPGTVLFTGERKKDGRIAGFAKIFKGNCNPIDYFVEGTLNEANGEIVLQGQAPVYSGQGCEVSGYSDSSDASTLKFSKLSDAPQSAVVAESTPDQEIEQGDRAPDSDYLPPSQKPGVDHNANRPKKQVERSPAQTEQVKPRSSEPDEATTPRRNRELDQPNRNRSASRDRDDPATIDEDDGLRQRRGYSRYPDYDRDRRYSRRYDDRPYRRRPRIWDPEDDFDPDDEDYYEEFDRPISPFWGRRPF
jgi:hypothetical protein